MKIKAVQWNIGGGRVFKPGSDPTLTSSYTEDGLEHIIDFLRSQLPDIVTLQETHTDNRRCQTQQIAQALGHTAWINDVWAESHIQTGQKLGQGITSRFPIKNHDFAWFRNPGFMATTDNGNVVISSHDKGRSKCTIELGDERKLVVQTLHTIPFRRFGVDKESEKAQGVLSDMASTLSVQGAGLIQADFNLDSPSLCDLLPELFSAGFEEIPQTSATTQRGRRYDHILFMNLAVLDSTTVTNMRTDHYPLVTNLEVSLG